MLLLSKQAETPLEGVTKQLRVDYPDRALGWLSDLEWTRPTAVPLDRVDYTDDIFTRVRTKEQAKVAAFAKRIKAGWRKPVILIKRPGMPLLKAIDGHTRLTAYKSLDDKPPAMAWIGVAKTTKGPWDGFHKLQLATVSIQVLELAEHVRTAAGAEWFHEPIGALIVKHSHAELLAMRKSAQEAYPRDDPRVKKIRAAVVASRAAGHNTVSYQATSHEESWREKVEKLDASDDSVASAMQNAHDAGFREDANDEGEAFWKEVHDQVVSSRQSELPSSLSAQMKKMQQRESARIAAEKASRFPGGSLTINDQVENFGQKASSVPGKSGDPGEIAARIRELDWRWRDARKRVKNARGPTAAQSADRTRQKYEDELNALGATYSKGRGWQAPAPKKLIPQEPPKNPTPEQIQHATSVVSSLTDANLAKLVSDAKKANVAEHSDIDHVETQINKLRGELEQVEQTKSKQRLIIRIAFLIGGLALSLLSMHLGLPDWLNESVLLLPEAARETVEYKKKV